MICEYLRVTPTSANLDPNTISTSLESLHKLSDRETGGPLQRLNPFASADPLTFEFVAMSKGQDEPVEFYYGADGGLDVLKQRLRTIYPSSFDIDHVEVDLIEKLLEPKENQPDEVNERLELGWLNDSETVSAVTNRDGPIEVDGGIVQARPSLDDVTPYGVRWRGGGERRKDWMTTLMDFSETIAASANPPTDDDQKTGRAPLEPLINEIGNGEQPLAFQVVFQRRADWSRDARRRAGELLDGTDTLFQKFLRLESPGSDHRSGSRAGSTRTKGATSHNRAPPRTRGRPGGGPVRPTGDEDATRYDLVRSNTPKRTFSVNLRMLALSGDEGTPEELDAHLDPLRSVFDLLDGKYYEIDGRRLRSKGYLPGAGERHARSILEDFTVGHYRWQTAPNHESKRESARPRAEWERTRELHRGSSGFRHPLPALPGRESYRDSA